MALAGELDVGHRVEAQYVNPDAAARTWYPAIVQKVEVVDGVKKFTVLFIGTRGALCLRCIVFLFGGGAGGVCGCPVGLWHINRSRRPLLDVAEWNVLWCNGYSCNGCSCLSLACALPGPFLRPCALARTPHVNLVQAGYGAVQVVTSEQIRRVQAHGVRVPIPELRPGGAPAAGTRFLRVKGAVGRCTAVRTCAGGPVSSRVAGARVTVKYAPDGKYYAAKIESKVPGGWRVTYQQYGNEEVVPYEYIRAMSKTTEEGGEDEFVIPEHLKVLDTDTEKERNRKRKAVKAIKNSFRQHQCVLLPVLASRVLMHGPPCVPQPAPAPCGRPTEPIKSTIAPRVLHATPAY
jgi:hypothetical protein